MVAAILGGYAAVKTTSLASTTVADQALQLRRDIAHMQVLAMGWDVALRLSTAADGASYTVTCRTTTSGTPCTSVGGIPTDPATGSSFSITLTNSVTISPVSDTLDIDSLGRPTSGSTLIATNPVKTYTLSGGGNTATVKVRPVTGFAERS